MDTQLTLTTWDDLPAELEEAGLDFETVPSERRVARDDEGERR